MARTLLAAAGGLTHGVHPGAETSAGAEQFPILGIVILAVAWVIFLAVRMTLKPGEKEKNHIKRTILKDD
ncbi:MAG: hypothetical protein HYY65_09380 [Candidatus Tectomicrobia bacterium]|uniref:Uncharacterized protein n=1 Tax=Tectimicrobiota bacterium TaxID=2528274 RepID=A0A932M1V5_UNCTE|nr:hypothetical protein [Candidatus Tectomicrobia bacterium]